MKRILIASILTATLLPLAAQAGSYVPAFGTHSRSYDFSPYQAEGTGARLNADFDRQDREWGRGHCDGKKHHKHHGKKHHPHNGYGHHGEKH